MENVGLYRPSFYAYFLNGGVQRPSFSSLFLLSRKIRATALVFRYEAEYSYEVEYRYPVGARAYCDVTAKCQGILHTPRDTPLLFFGTWKKKSEDRAVAENALQGWFPAFIVLCIAFHLFCCVLIALHNGAHLCMVLCMFFQFKHIFVLLCDLF